MQSYEIKNKNATLNYLENIFNSKNLRFFSGDTRNYNLNVVGLRNGREITNKFSDSLFVFWRFNGNWTLLSFPITTKPGLSYFNEAYVNRLGGVAQLKEGRYRYGLGKHKGLYEALVPLQASTIERLNVNREVIREVSGNFGINIHRAAANGNSVNVNLWSAGCQVIPSGYDLFMDIAKKSLNNFPHITYTLIEL